MKLLGTLNFLPAIQEHEYTETREFILRYAEKIQEKSIITTIEDAVMKAGGKRDLIANSNGAWLTRRFSSVHDIATPCSTTECPKVVDTIIVGVVGNIQSVKEQRVVDA